MNRQTIIAALFALVVLGGQCALAQSGYDLFQKGLVQERAKGDLDEAIKLYQQIVEDHKDDRALVAKALVQMGQCYEKLGRAEARKAYERVVREFADQAEPVRIAREHLEQLDDGAPGRAKTELVWTYPMLTRAMAPSPDGRYVAFVDDQTGDLAVRDLKTGKNRRLTHNQIPWEIFAGDEIRFSPDGKWIAYNWFHDKDDRSKADLRIIGIDGSGSRIIYEPDGGVKRISPYAWFQNGTQILCRLLKDDWKRQAVVVSVAAGSVRVIEGPERRFSNMCLSPDGRYIVYDSRQHGTSGPDDIYLLPVDGGEEIPIIQHPADDDMLGWAPDGQMLVFRSDRGGQGDDAWMIQIIDGKPHGRPQRAVHFGPTDTVEGHFTEDGSFYYAQRSYGSGYESSHVFVAELEPDSGKVLATPEPLSAERTARRALSPDFSHDGKYLAYYVAPLPERSDQGDRYGPGNIVIRSLETGQEREITLSPKFSDGGAWPILRWNPDGRSILMFGCTEAGRRGLFQVDLASGKLNPLVLNPGKRDTPNWQLGKDPEPVEGDYASWGEWSPDGKAALYGYFHCKPDAPEEERFTQCRVMMRDLKTGKEKEVCRNPEGHIGFCNHAVSPNGRRLLIGTDNALWICPTTGAEPRQLLKLENASDLMEKKMEGFSEMIRWRVAWTPDSRHLMFLKGLRGAHELWRIAAQDGEPERLGTLPSSLGGSDYAMTELRVHPDGRRIAFVSWRWQQDQELRVIKNFLPDLAVTPAQLPNPPKGNYFVIHSEDDAEERASGTMINLGDSDLDLGEDERIVGIRFADIKVRRGASIKRAFVQFTAEGSAERDPTDLTIHAELSVNAESFTETEHNISSRKRTDASVKWSPEPWDFEGQRSKKQRTPDLSSLIQEVVAQPDWREGHSLVLIITGSGDRDAMSFDDGGRQYAPMLHVEY